MHIVIRNPKHIEREERDPDLASWHRTVIKGYMYRLCLPRPRTASPASPVHPTALTYRLNSEMSILIYSVVTDLAKLRGKSTSTPFMTAKSGCQCLLCAWLHEEKTETGVVKRRTVRQELQGHNINQTLQAVNSLGHPDRLGAFGYGLVLVIADNDCFISLANFRSLPRLTNEDVRVNILGRPLRAVT